MAKIKRFFFFLLTGVPGLLLTLFGLDIIEFTPQTKNLVLYIGLFLVGVAVLSSIIPTGKKVNIEKDLEV